MKKIKNYISLIFFLGILCSAHAVQYGPFYYDVRAMAMGNTIVAIPTNRTAIFHNSAGLDALGDKIEMSLAPITASLNGEFLTIARALADNKETLTNIGNIDSKFVDLIAELDGRWAGMEYLPEMTMASKNIGFGLYSVLPLEVRIESGHVIPKIVLRGQRDLVFTWAVGIPFKQTQHRMGVSVEYLQRTPIREYVTTYSQTFSLFDEISKKPLGIIGDYSKIQHGVSFDVGYMYENTGWRLAANLKDILGIIHGKMVIPSLNLGVAYMFPQFDEISYIENFILSMDITNVWGVDKETKKYEHFAKKLHMGFEVDFKYFAFRAGLNQGFPTVGAGVKFGVFKMDYAFFTEELGIYPNQNPRRKHVMSLGLDFKVNRKKRDTEKEDFVPFGKKDEELKKENDTGKVEFE